MGGKVAGAIIRAAVLAGSLAVWAGAEAAEDLALLPNPVGVSESFATDRSGLALGGWDPVAYQTDGAARPGSRLYEVVWAGSCWRFASAANRAAFLADPEAFAPRLGGYDVTGALAGRAVAADPSLFVVRDGRVYLFRTAAARDAFRGSAALAVRAEAAWPRVAAALVAS